MEGTISYSHIRESPVSCPAEEATSGCALPFVKGEVPPRLESLSRSLESRPDTPCDHIFSLLDIYHSSTVSPSIAQSQCVLSPP